MIWAGAVSLVNGRVVTESGIAASIRVSSRVLSIDEPPRTGDTVVDLEGAYVLPGLVNAHDHLEFNHFGRLAGRERYLNASEWIDDVQPRIAADPVIQVARSHPLVERLFIGALKNLLAGVTLVAHHNPFYRELRREMPIRVLRRYGWAHSFALQQRPAGARGEPGGDIAGRYRATPSTAPFFVHIAEGIDSDARAELARLDAIGCLRANTVLVHGVGIDEDGWRRVADVGAGVVWCPASNLALFSRTAAVAELRRLRGGPVAGIALGTDSRVTGARDLLDELRVARGSSSISSSDLLAMVTSAAADLVRRERAGRLAVGYPADLLVIPPLAAGAADALVETRRRDVRLVMVDGRPVVGDRGWAARIFETRRVAARSMCVDGAEKMAAASLARRIAASPIGEPGVAVR